MRLTVRDERRQFNRQTHAYAEYRAFSGSLGTGVPVEEVTVTLIRRSANDAARDEGRVVCTIAVTVASGDVVEARAVARHAYAAIDRAVSVIRHKPIVAARTPPRTRRAAAGGESA